MKYSILTLLFVMLALPLRAHAQVPVSSEEPLVNQYVADAYAQRSAAWWNALGRQLTLLVDRPYEQVDAAALQNIIFFATHHRENVKLDDAVPHLFEIYRKHQQVEARMMALAALHALRDETVMRDVYDVAKTDTSERMRKMAVAVLNDYYLAQ